MAAPNVPRGIARLSRRLFSLSGRDAASFLNGMTSATVPASAGDVAYSGLFTPNGRVQHDLLVYARAPADSSQATPDYVLEVDGAEASGLARRLRFYKLRAKFDMRLLDPAEMGVYHLWNDGGGGSVADLQGRLAEGTTLCADPRLPDLGYRLLAPGEAVPAAGLDEVAEESYRVRRYLRGVAENQDEIPRESALPLEYNMELMHGIDFKKGCYVGQELQARTKYLGVVQKRVLPCIIYDADGGGSGNGPENLEYRPATAGGVDARTIAGGATVEKVRKEGDPPPGRRDRKPGKWIAGVGNVGLAVCRLAVMTDVVPPHPADMPMESTYGPGDEFAVEAEGAAGGVRVKAFAPEWLRKGLEEYGR